MPDTPESTPPVLSPHSPDSSGKTIALTEMPIRVDAPNESYLPPEEVSLKIRSAVQGLMFGIGSYSLAYIGLRDLDLTDLSSFMARVATGVVTGGAFALGMHKLRAGLRETYILDNAKAGHYLRMFRALAHACLGGVALASVGAPLVGNFLDFEQNLSLRQSVAETEAALVGLAEDPRSFPDIVNLETDLHTKVLAHLSPTGEMTPEAYTAMLLYYDGQQIKFNPTLDPGAELKDVREESVGGRPWTIGSFEPNSWLVQGPDISWWVGKNAESPTVNEIFDQKKAESPKPYSPYKTVFESDKINGKPAVVELLEKVGAPKKPEPLGADLERLNAWAPFEWNRHWRSTVNGHADASYQAFTSDYSARVNAAEQSMFGPATLEDPTSYPALEHSLSPSQ